MDSLRSEGYVSLGPTCLPAEILKAGELRSCTFGFDWFRSGEYFIRKFLSSSDSFRFVDDCVLNPHIPLVQTANPDVFNSHTAEIAKAPTLYGFDYLYNPHRPLYDLDTHAYFYRAFQRLSSFIREPTALKHFFIADYTNKPHHTFFHDPNHVMKSMRMLLESSSISTFDITLLRLELTDDRCCFNVDSTHGIVNVTEPFYNCPKLSDRLVTLSVSASLHDNPEYRTRMYKSVAKRLYSANILPLWSPDC
jgi:hypothetical protein